MDKKMSQIALLICIVILTLVLFIGGIFVPFIASAQGTSDPIATAVAGTVQAVLTASAMPPAGKQPHVIGQPWEMQDVSLNLIKVDIRAGSGGEDAAAQIWFKLLNKSGERLLVDVDFNDIHIEDDLGNRYVDWDGKGTASTWVEPGRTFTLARYYTRQPKERSRIPSRTSNILIIVKRFSRVNDVRWKYGINPELTPIDAPKTAKPVGDTWTQNGVAITLDKVDIRAGSGGEDAAARVWFTVSNQSNDRLLVEIDLSHVYLLDSFGQRYSDWDGAGMLVQWVDPGKSFQFARYYTRMAGQRSRVARGANFVLIIVEQMTRIENAQWKSDIIR